MTESNRILLPGVLPSLRGEQVLLRRMEEGDAAALFDIYGDPLVMKYTDEPPFPDLETVGLMLESVRRLLAEGESLEWAVVLRDSGLVVGTCGLHSFDTTLRTAEVGCLLRRSAWGKGHMAEALGLVTQFAAKVLGLNRLLADVAADNLQAHNLFRKLGYRKAGSALLEVALSLSAR
jgi:[ribosomal protein S5]-alanine N-acetyltransferase